jgi:hypothetical protein
MTMVAGFVKHYRIAAGPDDEHPILRIPGIRTLMHDSVMLL